MRLLRDCGFRTFAEIERERYALKALRGDFQELPPTNGTAAAGAVKQAFDAVDR